MEGVRQVNQGVISIHPLRGEWDEDIQGKQMTKAISIHPLRGEWDRGTGGEG